MGSSSRLERAPICAKPAITNGVIIASLPPARTTSQRSSASRSRAVPMAVAPEAQAVATTRLGPVAPNSMAV